MSAVEPYRDVTLVELVDRVLAKGVVLSGDVTLSVADVDLIRLELRAVLASVASLEPERAGNGATP
jgi:Gas vesicle protein